MVASPERVNRTRIACRRSAFGTFAGRPLSAMEPTEPDVTPEASWNKVVIATNRDDESLDRVRRLMLQMATRDGFAVVLYDRSNERWTDTPHPKGPLTADQVDADERPHLVEQLREFEAAGVTATAWLATVPALTAMIDVLQEMSVDAIVLPDDFGSRKMMDRLQIGGDPAEMVQRIADLQLERPPVVVVVDGDGVMTVSEFADDH
jgi:hypothetical protein